MRRIPRATWITIIIIGLFSMLVSLMGNVGATALTWLSPQLALILFILISLILIGFSLWQEKQKVDIESSDTVARENREIMLVRVKTKWITGFLENVLYYDEELLPLPLRERVGSRYDLVLANPLDPTHPLPTGTTITQVFDHARGKLLILGEPGAGKTTLLLELARDLLERAGDDENAPIPVLFTLSSWATKQLPLEQWVVEELRMKYQIPSPIGQVWMNTNQLLLLLDGLDEMPPNAQPACIEILNRYTYQTNRSLVVCSRAYDYMDQPRRLSLHTAVVIQPLTQEKIDNYLSLLGEEVSSLKRLLQHSETLTALAVTPLLLKVLILAYHGKSMQELLPLLKTMPLVKRVPLKKVSLVESTLPEQHRLFHDYVERMLQREGTRLHASTQQTRYWLAWLARQLIAHNNQSEFYLEQLQQDWLPDKPITRISRIGLRLALGLVEELTIGEKFIGKKNIEKNIDLREITVWSWTKEGERELVIKSIIGLLGGLLFGLLGGLLRWLGVGLLELLGWQPFGPNTLLTTMLTSGLFFGLFFGLQGFFSYKSLEHRDRILPNQGIQHSGRNGLFFGLVTGLVTGLVPGLVPGLVRSPIWVTFMPINGLTIGLTFGLFFGLIGGLFNGGKAWVLHMALRFALWREGVTPAPWQYVAFLDDATDLLLLRKVGGGYVFRHRLLRDYFADLETESISDEAAESRNNILPPRATPSPPMEPIGADGLSDVPTAPLSSVSSDSSRLLPCGHERRSSARFCSVCGASVPP